MIVLHIKLRDCQTSNRNYFQRKSSRKISRKVSKRQTMTNEFQVNNICTLRGLVSNIQSQFMYIFDQSNSNNLDTTKFFKQ